MGGESQAAWRALLDDLVARGLATPELLIADGAPAWRRRSQRCGTTCRSSAARVHKHRKLLAHAPKNLYDEVSADYRLTRDLRQDGHGGGRQAQSLSARKWRRCADPGRDREAWKRPVKSSSPSCASRRPVEIDPDHQCHRTLVRGIRAPHQDPMHAALRRHRLHAILGVDGQRPDHAPAKSTTRSTFHLCPLAEQLFDQAA